MLCTVISGWWLTATSVLALSASGETEELLRILPAIARFQVKIIAICGNAESTLAQNAHVFLDVNIEQEACPLESRADFKHDGNAGARRRARDGAAGSARISKGGFREISSRRNGRPQFAHAGSPDNATAEALALVASGHDGFATCLKR